MKVVLVIYLLIGVHFAIQASRHAAMRARRERLITLVDQFVFHVLTPAWLVVGWLPMIVRRFAKPRAVIVPMNRAGRRAILSQERRGR